MNLSYDMYRLLGIALLLVLLFTPPVIRRKWALNFSWSAVLNFLCNCAVLVIGYALFVGAAEPESLIAAACVLIPLAAALTGGQLMREWSRAKMMARLGEMAPTKGGIGADAATPHEEQ